MLFGIFIWYLTCIALAGLLNLVLRRKFFNGSYFFLMLAGVAGAAQLIFGVLSNAATEATIVSALYWVVAAIPAAWAAKRFEKAHPFSFPSVIWSRSGRAAKARDA